MIKIILKTKNNQLEPKFTVNEFIIDHNTTAYQFIINNKLNLGEYSININDLYYSLIEAKEYILKDNDIVKIERLAGEIVTVAAVAKFFSLAANGFAATAIASVINTVALLSLNLIIGALSKKRGGSNGNNTLEKNQKSTNL